MFFDTKKMQLISCEEIICQSLCDARTVFRMKLVNFMHVCVPRRRPVSRAAPGPALVFDDTDNFNALFPIVSCYACEANMLKTKIEE